MKYHGYLYSSVKVTLKTKIFLGKVIQVIVFFINFAPNSVFYYNELNFLLLLNYFY